MPGHFPIELLPLDAGLILADAYGGLVIREAPRVPLAPARRRAVTQDFARLAAARLHAALDPDLALSRHAS